MIPKHSSHVEDGRPRGMKPTQAWVLVLAWHTLAITTQSPCLCLNSQLSIYLHVVWVTGNPLREIRFGRNKGKCRTTPFF